MPSGNCALLTLALSLLLLYLFTISHPKEALLSALQRLKNASDVGTFVILRGELTLRPQTLPLPLPVP